MHCPLVSRRRFLHAGLAIGAGCMLPEAHRVFADPPSDYERDVAVIRNMIQLNLFGGITHCVGEYANLSAIKLFLNIMRGNQITSVDRTNSNDITAIFMTTARGPTVTLYKDRSAARNYAGIFRIQGTRGICMLDLNQIYLQDVSPNPGVWEDFSIYRDMFADAIRIETKAAKASPLGLPLKWQARRESRSEPA